MTEIEKRIGFARTEAGKTSVAMGWGSAWFGHHGGLGGGNGGGGQTNPLMVRLEPHTLNRRW